MRRAILLTMLMTAPALAARQPCQVGVVYFANPLPARMGEHPTRDCVYSLRTAVPLQKLKNGYLLADAFTQDPDQFGVVFLYTADAYQQNHVIEDGFAEFAGTYKFTGLNGFPQTVYAFRKVRR